MNYEELVKALRCCDEYALCNDCPIFETCDGDVDKAMAIAAAAIEELQAQLPKRGKWIFDGKFMELHKFRCSNCKRTEFRMSDYCPNCGADMRKMEVQE